MKIINGRFIEVDCWSNYIPQKEAIIMIDIDDIVSIETCDRTYCGVTTKSGRSYKIAAPYKEMCRLFIKHPDRKAGNLVRYYGAGVAAWAAIFLICSMIYRINF